jgi:hypothetical protein
MEFLIGAGCVLSAWLLWTGIKMLLAKKAVEAVVEPVPQWKPLFIEEAKIEVPPLTQEDIDFFTKSRWD